MTLKILTRPLAAGVESFSQREQTMMGIRLGIGYSSRGRRRTLACRLPCDSFLMPRAIRIVYREAAWQRAVWYLRSQAMSKTESGRASTSALFSPVALVCSRPAAQLCVFCTKDACRGLEVVSAITNNSLAQHGDDCNLASRVVSKAIALRVTRHE